MKQSIRIYLAQMNCVACDLAGNAARILEAARQAKKAGAALCVTPAFSLTGWPLMGWLGQTDFAKALEVSRRELAATLAREVPGMTVLVGLPVVEEGKSFNSLFALKDGACLARHDKRELDEDEKLIFARGEGTVVIEINGNNVGLAFAEELLNESCLREHKQLGVQLICAAGSLTYMRGVSEGRRTRVLVNSSREAMPLIVVNQVGAQDERIFEGSSFVTDAAGRLAFEMAHFQEDTAVVDESFLFESSIPEVTRSKPEFETLFEALVCAVRDYAGKNGFTDALLGLSGGADSALVAAIAVEALGRDHVHAVMMPTRYTSDLSLRLARECAENLGIDYRIRPVGVIYDAAMSLYEEDFEGTPPGLAEENLQARSRGLTLMALSNKFGWLTLATGNKSESATGYCTLYGDTTGGYAPIKDIFKTDVWELMRTYNRMKGREVIPQEIITRPPSAELKEGQTDEAALMPYEQLDAILRGLLEFGEGIEELADKGFKREDVRRVIRLLYRSEFKRRQCPTGPKVSRSTLGVDVCLPMTSRPSFV